MILINLPGGMKKLAPVLILTVFITGVLAWTIRPLSGQAPPPGKLALFADMALFAGPGRPRNCNLMNRFKPGEPAGFRVSVIDGMTGEPAADASVVIHLTYGGKTVDVPARYRGVPGGGPVVPNMWTAKWTVPADAPTGVVRVRVTAKDKRGRTAEWTPFPDEQAQLTIVRE
jgi:hypothetical protein